MIVVRLGCICKIFNVKLIYKLLCGISYKGDIMNRNIYLKCNVCETVTQVRVQVGWIEKFPIRVPCGKCHTVINGMFKCNYEDATIEYEFDGCNEVIPQMPDYFLEAAGDLLTEKLIKINCKEDLIQPTPYFKAIWAMSKGDNNGLNGTDYEEFKQTLTDFLGVIDCDFSNWKIINELWINRKYEYLPNRLIEYFDDGKYDFSNKAECYDAINQLNINFFYLIMDKKRYQDTKSFLINNFSIINTTHKEKVISIINYLGDKLDLYQEDIYGQLKKFVEIFPNVLPIYATTFYNKDRLKCELMYQGITTMSFEDLKSFYIDSFEVICKMLEVIWILNNLIHRSETDVFKKEYPKGVCNIKEYNKLVNAKKINYIDKNEKFSYFVTEVLDNKLRNAIGHKSYKVNNITQIIKYNFRGNKYSESTLLLFGVDCWQLFLLLIDYSQLVAVLIKLKFHYRNQ